MKTVAVITGGAGGMGLASAKLLGQHHTIVISDVDKDKLAEAKDELTKQDITSETVVCDITDPGAVDSLVQSAQALGEVRAVIHAAGVSPSMATADQIMKINALGTINITQAFYQIAKEGFVLVNVASMAGHMLPGLLVPSRSFKYANTDQDKFLRKLLNKTKLLPSKQRPGIAYAISKTFVIWYSRIVAGQFGEKGARILSVSPGSFDTAMGRLEKDAGAEKMLEHAAIKRFGEPVEIAEVLAFCASEKASYLTGTDVLCDGGVIAGLKRK